MNLEKFIHPENFSLRNIEVKRFIYYTILSVIFTYLPTYLCDTFYHDNQSRGERRGMEGFGGT